MSLFDDALALVLVSEGGKVDNPADPGGRTNKGITQDTYNAWRARQGVGTRDVYLIADSEVASIYRTEYADKIRFDELPAGVGYCVLDAAVNSGVSRGIKLLQNALGVTADGALGPVTMAAIKAADPQVLIGGISAARLAFLMGLKTWPTFGKGWSNRVSLVHTHAIQMVGKPAKPIAVPRVVPAAPPIKPVPAPVEPLPAPKPGSNPVPPALGARPSFWATIWQGIIAFFRNHQG